MHILEKNLNSNHLLTHLVDQKASATFVHREV